MLDMCTENQCITLEKTEGTIKNGQSRETDNIGYTKHKTKTNRQIPSRFMYASDIIHFNKVLISSKLFMTILIIVILVHPS
jgi:hypothetical protein